jgi:hypothetical protein
MKFIAPIILFLDKDLEKSAQSLTNIHLEICIKNSVQVLMCAIYYILGFRTKKIFKYYVSKERWDETKMKFMPQYPLNKMPKFSYYVSRESRWCRQCSDHYNYLVKYLECLLSEYSFRFNKDHPLYEMFYFLRTLPMELAIRKGIIFPKLKDKTKMQLPWKNLPVKFRKKNLIDGYREYYKSIIISPLDEFIGTKRDVPDFLVEKLKTQI